MTGRPKGPFEGRFPHEDVHLDGDPVDQLHGHLAKWRDDREGLLAKESRIRAYARERLSPEVLGKEIAAIVNWHWRN